MSNWVGPGLRYLFSTGQASLKLFGIEFCWMSSKKLWKALRPRVTCRKCEDYSESFCRTQTAETFAEAAKTTKAFSIQVNTSHKSGPGKSPVSSTRALRITGLSCEATCAIVIYLLRSRPHCGCLALASFNNAQGSHRNSATLPLLRVSRYFEALSQVAKKDDSVSSCFISSSLLLDAVMSGCSHTSAFLFLSCAEVPRCDWYRLIRIHGMFPICQMTGCIGFTRNGLAGSQQVLHAGDKACAAVDLKSGKIMKNPGPSQNNEMNYQAWSNRHAQKNCAAL